MTDTGSQEKLEGGEAAVEVPAPEPWTPRRVFEWNSYYDLYVAGFVVLLAFFGTANKIPALNSSIWSLLQAGRQIAETRAPMVVDTTSIAGQGRRWVNVPWLYEVSHYAIFEAAASLAAKPEPGAPAPRVSGPREQYGAGALIAVDALVRALAALLLLGLRRKGPGLWWTSLCVVMALGVTLGPATIESISAAPGGEVIRNIRPWLGVQIGGVASPASVVSPESWGILFLAIEILLLHQAIHLGKLGRLYALVPLFLLWANSDDSFGFGLVILASSAIGLALGSRRDPSRPSVRPVWIALGLSIAATFVNPSHVYGVLAGFDSILKPLASLPNALMPRASAPANFRSSLVFSPSFTPAGLEGVAQSLRLYYAVLVGLGLVSFLLNRKAFSIARFLPFAVASVLWGLSFNSLTGPFSLVLAATLAMNGQEWYQRAYGVEGRLGAGWTVWSTGGRLVTIAVVFAAIARGVTGWGGSGGRPPVRLRLQPRRLPVRGGRRRSATRRSRGASSTPASRRGTPSPGRGPIEAAGLRRQPGSTSIPAVGLRRLPRALRNDLKNDDRWARPSTSRAGSRCSTGNKISAVMIQLHRQPAGRRPQHLRPAAGPAPTGCRSTTTAPW